MNPISLCGGLLVIGVLINLTTRDKFAVYYTFFPAFLAICLLMFDNKFGVDQSAYLRMFDQINIDNWNEYGTNPGYALLNAIVKFFGGDYWTLLFIMNLFSMTVLTVTFNKYSPFIALSWLIYFSLHMGYNLGIVRQGMALTFTIMSFKYILSKERNKYLLCMLAAFFFHYSMVTFIPAYWIANRITVNRRKAFIIMAIAFPLVLVNLLDIIGLVASKAGLPQWQIELYLTEGGKYNERAGLSPGLIVRMLLFFGFALSADLNDRLQRVLFNLYFVYLLLYFPLSSISILSSRGLDYYKVFECITVPLAVLNIKNIYWKMVYVCFVLAFFIYSIFNNYTVYVKETNLDSALKSIMNSF
ncbi:MAG: EpsG family protein [Rikenellaceae bacterium]|nr:EpsG family protein [Rikenellaceae bacterium]